MSPTMSTNNNNSHEHKEGEKEMIVSSLKVERELNLKTFASLLGASTAVSNSNSTPMNHYNPQAIGFLGHGMVKADMATTPTTTFSDLLDKGRTTLCTVPSLDIFSGNNMPDLSILLSAGSSTNNKNLTTTTSTTTGGFEHPCMPPPAPLPPQIQQQQQQCSIPEMKASIFSKLFPEGIPLSVEPCFLKDSETLLISSTAPADVDGTNPKTNCEEIDSNILENGVVNLAEPISWTRSSCPQVPMSLVRSLSQSFSSLLDSRMKACTLLLLRHSLANGDYRSRSRLLALLSPSSTIGIKSITTSFNATTTLPQDLKQVQPTPAVDDDDPDKIVLPLLFEACIILMIGQQKEIDVKFKVTGAINGYFNHSTSLLNGVEVTIDTEALLNTMIEEAQQLVVLAVAAASSPSSNTSSSSISDQTTRPPPVQIRRDLYHSNASLAVTPMVQEQPTADASDHQSELPSPITSSGPAKISPSASPLQSFASMKLIGMLKDVGREGDTFSLTRRDSTDALTLVNRQDKKHSVTWNQSVKAPSLSLTDSSSKRRKTVDQLQRLNPTLRSSKSFGRPDSTAFKCARNETFAEFGRAGQKSASLNSQQHQNQQNYTPPLSSTRRGLVTQSVGFSLNRATGNTSSSLAAPTSTMNSSFPTLTRPKNDLLASFAAASSQLGGGQQGGGMMDLSDLRGFIGGALGAPKY